MAAVPAPKAPAPKVITDPAAHFARSAREKLGDRLQYCEESFAPGYDQPVLFAVLQNGAPPEDRMVVQTLHHDADWPNKTAPDLHILDASAWEAMQALAASGFITIHTRARRPLLEVNDQPTLPPEQLAEIRRLRDLAEKKRRAATALEAAGLPDEAEPLAAQATEAEANAAAIEGSVTENPAITAP